MVLPDLLQHGLRLVFCGTAAGSRSAMVKAYYAGPGNKFYKVMAKFGFTPHQTDPGNFAELVNYKIGLTDLAKHTHGADNTLQPGDYDIESFKNKMLLYQPGVICFNGKQAAKIYLGLRSTKNVSYGKQSFTIGRSIVFVAPSTSGSANGSWDERYWQELSALVSDINMTSAEHLKIEQYK